MPDISMCLNKQCESRTTCYRFTAIPSEYRQSYSDLQPVDGEDKCGNYLQAARRVFAFLPVRDVYDTYLEVPNNVAQRNERR